ncbi:hypothetical protein COCCADRAFT_8094 [Bipolaris zeicola 26-R-13]|uniref:Uncharacterized protein n=1 Tax=Cochliobolus carbonum (strain 26-R-13) TaxID=930089 RepID=W6YEW1_COCC2|nr:uncharacterized protein COCCADRAFT_8094 [Bipolaris zeicola 26-R-13]EUC29751.1 hypothetical protein COCCADRAFT_8094 [Bipolaris zeicola 26-R-13]
MSGFQEGRKFFFKSPDVEYNLEGPIQIGNIITDMKNPQDPISMLHPMPTIIKGPGYDKGKKTHEGHSSVKLSLSAKIYELFGGQAEARSKKSLQTKYEFDEIESLYLQKNPTRADAKRLRDDDAEVRGALNRGPVYVATGLKIAKGLRYSNIRMTNKGGSLEAQGRVANEASVGGSLEAEKGGEDLENYTVKGDTILAYRLHIIKKESWRWLGEQDLEVKSQEAGEGGFMNHDEQAGERSVIIEEVNLKDARYFAEDEEYGDVEETCLEDGEEEWFLLSID